MSDKLNKIILESHDNTDAACRIMTENQISYLLTEFKKIKNENNILKECVRFYADHTHVDYNNKKAIQTLRKIND